MADYFLGVDGGGSVTTAVAADESGKILANVKGSSISRYSAGDEQAKANMKSILEEIECIAGISHYKAVVIGSATLNEQASEEELENFSSGIIDSEKIYMDSDLYIALNNICENECAIVISGTGSVAAVRTSEGKIIHSGGWGYALGDEGSGYRIGIEGIKSAIAYSEGRAGSEILYKKCLEHYGIRTLQSLPDAFYCGGINRKKTAEFAVQVCNAAQNGDEQAYSILCTQAKALAETAMSCISQIPADSAIGLWGGVFCGCELFRKLFSDNMSGKGYNNIRCLSSAPVFGALKLAFAISGTKVPFSFI